MEGKLFDWVVSKSDLLSEPIPGASLVELLGDNRVLIQYHRGVTVYCCSEIHVRVSYGTLCVRGRGLQLAQMTKHQMIITGCVDSVALIRGGR